MQLTSDARATRKLGIRLSVRPALRFNTPPKQPNISSLMMGHSSPPSLPVEKKKKKKSKNKESASLSTSTIGGAQASSSTIEDSDGISRAIQTALDHVAGDGAITTLSSTPSDLSQDGAGTSSSKKRRAAGASNDPGLDSLVQQKPKKKKTKENSISSTSPPNANQASTSHVPNVSQLVPEYIPAQHEPTHIPIDPALTVNEQMIQHNSLPQPSPSNAAFVNDLTGATEGLSSDTHVPGSYIFSQEADLLNSNEDILRALQGFDMSKFAGALKSYTDSLASEHSTAAQSQSSQAGPSRLAGAALPIAAQSPSVAGQKSRSRKIVAPQPGSQVVNPEHADILATHWLNPAKLAELVKEQGKFYS